MDEADYIVVSTLHNTITVHRPDARSERYSLFRFESGDVYWRIDDFDYDPDAREPSWMGSRGAVTVGEVVRRLPDHARTVLGWTEREIELGTVIADDIFIAARRKDALERLQRQFDAAADELRAP